jgi:threonine/homoserine/homoserine lactone efflux protein
VGRRRDGDGVRPRVLWPEMRLGLVVVAGAVSLVLAKAPALLTALGIFAALVAAVMIVARWLGFGLLSWLGFERVSQGGSEQGGGGEVARWEREEDVGGGAP